jgi:Lon protease-like protein
MSDNDQRLPLIPLADLVHFPRTQVSLHVQEPRYRRLVRDLLTLKDEESRLIGLVVVKPGRDREHQESPREIFPGGTAGRLVEVEPLPDGRSNIVLEGQFRFVIRYEVSSEPYRRAVVEPVEEPSYNDADAGIQMVRCEILDLGRRLAEETSGRFPFDEERLTELSDHSTFEEVVNSFSAGLDVPTLRKLQLLVAALPDRALNLLSILKARHRVLELLRPFRPLAENAELN